MHWILTDAVVGAFLAVCLRLEQRKGAPVPSKELSHKQGLEVACKGLKEKKRRARLFRILVLARGAWAGRLLCDPAKPFFLASAIFQEEGTAGVGSQRVAAIQDGVLHELSEVLCGCGHGESPLGWFWSAGRKWSGRPGTALCTVLYSCTVLLHLF